ncbi:Secreted protein [Burkholderia sp. IT-111MI5]
MTLNLSSSRIVIVIRSVVVIAASGAEHPAAEQLTRPESGHFYVAKSGHFNLATTTSQFDNSRQVKSLITAGATPVGTKPHKH